MGGNDDNSQTFTWTADMSSMQAAIRASEAEVKKFTKALADTMKIAKDGELVLGKSFEPIRDNLKDAISEMELYRRKYAEIINEAKKPLPPLPMFGPGREQFDERMAFKGAMLKGVGGGGPGAGYSGSSDVVAQLRIAKGQSDANEREEAFLNKLAPIRLREMQDADKQNKIEEIGVGILRAKNREREREAELIAFQQAKGGLRSEAVSGSDVNVPGGGMMALQQMSAKKGLLDVNRQLLAEEKDEVALIRQRKAEHREFVAGLTDRVAKTEQLAGVQKLADEAVVTSGGSQAKYYLELVKTTKAIEDNKRQIHELATSTVGTSQVREQAQLALAQKNEVLSKRQRELNIQIESGSKSLMGNRMQMQSLTYAIQDFVSGGGLQNVALGFRGAANNIEMMFMSMGRTLSPLQMMGLSLLPTAALAGVELAVSMGKSGKAAKDAGEQIKEYGEHVKRAKEEVEELTLKESAREKLRAQREGGKLIAEGVAQERQAHEEFREIEHNMNVWAGKEQVQGIGDMLGVGWFGAKALARRAAKNAGQIGGNLFGRMAPLWKVDTVHDQMADAELQLRGARMQQAEGQQAVMAKEAIVNNRQGIKDEIRRQQRTIEAKEEEKHGVEAGRDAEIARRKGRALPRHRQREIEVELRGLDDEIKSLRDKLKKFERAAEDNPGKSLEDVMKQLTAAINTSNRLMGLDGVPARVPNLFGERMAS